jgi:hypothetical protein
MNNYYIAILSVQVRVRRQLLLLQTFARLAPIAQPQIMRLIFARYVLVEEIVLYKDKTAIKYKIYLYFLLFPQLCEPGKFGATSNRNTQCTSCAANTYTPSAGMTACLDCPSGIACCVITSCYFWRFCVCVCVCVCMCVCVHGSVM